MFRDRRSDSKSESSDDRLRLADNPTTKLSPSSDHNTNTIQHDERIRSLSGAISTSKQQFPIARSNFFGGHIGNIPMEEVESHRHRGIGNNYQASTANTTTTSKAQPTNGNFQQSSDMQSSSSGNNQISKTNPNQRNYPNNNQSVVPTIGSTNRTSQQHDHHHHQNMNHQHHQSNQQQSSSNKLSTKSPSTRSMSNSESLMTTPNSGNHNNSSSNRLTSSSSTMQQNGNNNNNNLTLKQRALSTSAIKSNQQIPRDEFRTVSLTSNGLVAGLTNRLVQSNHHQQNVSRIADDVATMIKEELENELDGLKEEDGALQQKQRHQQLQLKQPTSTNQQDTTNLDNLSSFDRDLPVELSFIIKQQAFCMARMNYLDRQIRELKESRPTSSGSSATATPVAINHQAQMQAQYQNHHPQQYLQHHQLQPQLHYNQQQAFSTVPSYLYPQNQQQQHQAQLQSQYQQPMFQLPNQLMQHPQARTMIGGQQLLQQQQHHNPHQNIPITSHGKNGHFILSDDSGGEYSRATISDDDELSSLLDQIAKSVRTERGVGGGGGGSGNGSMMMNGHHQQNPNGSILNGASNQQQQVPLSSHIQQQQLQRNQQQQFQPQQYTILNHPNQLHHHHHQAVPVFVMGSPIAVAHPSSISSTVLPGVHFQPEPRYNQYYEDFYTLQNTSSNGNLAAAVASTSSLIHQQQFKAQQHHHRTQQFDNSLSAIEQLVSRKEKRQIKSQLRSADNWLKMRSSGLCSATTALNATNFNGTNLNGVGKTNGTSSSKALVDTATATSTSGGGGTSAGVGVGGGRDHALNGGNVGRIGSDDRNNLTTSASSTTTTTSATENSSSAN